MNSSAVEVNATSNQVNSIAIIGGNSSRPDSRTSSKCSVESPPLPLPETTCTAIENQVDDENTDDDSEATTEDGLPTEDDYKQDDEHKEAETTALVEADNSQIKEEGNRQNKKITLERDGNRRATGRGQDKLVSVNRGYRVRIVHRRVGN